jgi:hypothetical protein
MDLDVTLKTQTIEVEITNRTLGLPSATAENDVIVANSSLSWVKKTLAQLKTILSLGTAAYTASTDYAAASHTHGERDITPKGFTTETGGYLGVIMIDCTTYKDHKYNSIEGDTDWQINNFTSGDAGMLVFIIDATGGYTITMNASYWTKKVGSGTVDNTATAVNVVSWRAIGTDIYYTINQVE